MPFSFGVSNSKTSGTQDGTDTTSGTTDFNQTGTSDTTNAGTSNLAGTSALTGAQASNLASNSTTTANLPDWISQMAQGAGAGATALAGDNPASYVAGANPLLQTAANSAADLNGTPWGYDAATDVTRGVAQDGTPNIAGNLDSFMSPYISKVYNSTAADLDHQAGLTRAQQSLDLAGSGAFGGSGAALTQAATEGELQRARASSLSGILNQGYDTALQGATAQAGLQQQQQQQQLSAAAQLAGIANDYGANTRANIATQDNAAAPIQTIQQAQAQAPLALQSWLASIFPNLDPSIFAGSTTTGGQTGDTTTAQNATNNQVGSTTGTSNTATTQAGVENQNSVENQNLNTTGNTTGLSFGFKGG